MTASLIDLPVLVDLPAGVLATFLVFLRDLRTA